MRSSARRVLAEPGFRWHAQGAQPFDGLANAPRRLAEARDVAQANAPGTEPHEPRVRGCADARGIVSRGAASLPLARTTRRWLFDPCCAPVHDGRGYSISRDRASGGGRRCFGGWAEIIQEGRRVERSGLIGPRYANSVDSAGVCARMVAPLDRRTGDAPADARAAGTGCHDSRHGYDGPRRATGPDGADEPYDERRFLKEDASERAYNERTESRLRRHSGLDPLSRLARAADPQAKTRCPCGAGRTAPGHFFIDGPYLSSKNATMSSSPRYVPGLEPR